MINANSTFARYNGLAVMITQYGAFYSQVRYVGPDGKQITEEIFSVETEKLTNM